MNREVNEENKKKRLKLYYGLLITVIIVIGVSFAWFRLTRTQTNSNVIGTRSCLDTTLTEETSEIVLTDAFPISDADGLKQTPFTFTLTNNCDSYVKVTIALVSDYRTSTDASHLKDDYVKTNLSTKGITDGSSVILSSLTLGEVDTNTEGYILKTTGLKNKEAKSFDLRLWLNSETTNEQGLNKTWKGKIVVSIDAAVQTLREEILANNEVKEPLSTPGREVSAYTLNDVTLTSTKNVSSTEQAHYFTYGTGWEANGTKFDLTGTKVTSDTYANSYSELIGKYLPSKSFYVASSSTAGEMVAATKLTEIYYVVSATSSSYTYKMITSNKNQTEALLASAEDDYGTSYYFRGAVKNNYIEFANKCWRIVRIIGDGSIKLVLHNDNTSGANNPCSSVNNSDTAAFAHYDGTTYTSAFNSSNTDHSYFGFMYGDNFGCEDHPEITNKSDCEKNNYTWIGSLSYDEAHANINKSIILTNLETWYTNNLASYVDKLADTIWCNDKSTFTTYTGGSTMGTGLGYGTNQTGYGAMNRISGGSATLYANPSLICPNDNNGGKLSKFTVDDTTNGNGNLTYKIGLLTADEIAFVGAKSEQYNSTIYLNENAKMNWWTLSPEWFYSRPQIYQTSGGYLRYDSATSKSGLRPAIALVSSTTISGGSGTSEDPYIVN